MSFKSVLIGLLITVLVGLFVVAPAFAQDVPPPDEIVEVTPPTDGTPVVEDDMPTYLIFTAIILALLAVIVFVLRPLIVQLGASAPAWAIEAGYAAVEKLLKEAQRKATESSGTIDDAAVAELRAEFERLKKQIDEARFLAPQSNVG